MFRVATGGVGKVRNAARWQAIVLPSVLGLGILAGPLQGESPTPPAEATEAAEIAWSDDYSAAHTRASAAGKLLLIYFREAAAENSPFARFEQQALREPKNLEILKRLECVRLDLAAAPATEGATSGASSKASPGQTLLDHPCFAEMQRRGGVAIVDLANRQAPYYGGVVSVVPFHLSGGLSPYGLKLLLELPAGTLTQRSMLFAVRTHSTRPGSAWGEWSSTLAAASESASAYQASINTQGHHHWETRFHQINAQLPGGMASQEVCAESWPNQGLFESCYECVNSWRQSPGHWGAVNRTQPLFGYDIKQGSNGIWYGTGIFANFGG